MKWIAAALVLAGCLEAPPAGPPGGGDGPCGTLRALRDDFESALDPGQWVESNVAVSGGEAHLTGEPGGPDATLDSLPFYRTTDGQLTLDVDVSQLSTGALELSLIDTGDSALVVRVENGQLTVSSVPEGGGGAVLVDQPFMIGEHLWRLREAGGAWFWATSTGPGEPFIETGPLSLELGDLVRLEVVLHPNDASAFAIRSINQDESEPPCAAASLTDDFESLDPRWEEEAQATCTITVDGTALLGYSEQAFCALTTRERFDLRESAFSVELADAGDCAPEPVMLVRLADDRAFSFLCHDDAGSHRLIARSDDGDIVDIDFDEDKHRFIRVRHDGQEKVLVFEASPGDGTWARVGVAGIDDTEPLARTSLRLLLGGEPTRPATLDTVEFDSVGLAPEAVGASALRP